MKKKLFKKSSNYYLLIAILHLCTFSWIWIIAKQSPTQLGLGFVAYTLGLRHAFDADHIAAIDNSVRKLVNQKQKATGVGFYFSLGHSTVVIFIVLLLNLSATLFKEKISFLSNLGDKTGGIISGTFLLFLAVNNLIILLNIKKQLNHTSLEENQLNNLLNSRGPLTKILTPFLRMVTKAWHMYPIGFLFGLGFDTATEIGLISISAESNRFALGWNSMVFPLLFAAGMMLMDTTDSVMMSGAYNWAFSMPERKLHYNLTITFISIIVAFLIGSIELLQSGTIIFTKLSKLNLWLANIDLNSLGIYIVILFSLLWASYYIGWQYKIQKSKI
ncbi:HoxN/HupN/NixA family nickel/cobalt transporter [Ligilactobacillus sp. WILCCON 0076]|uniref:Nickel/cobalt efflux system n=1 Tax=Ligilactobacillus ubinensis TaxID=2876789 RepID=A0A9X2JKI7_9LACO|nr:HoxN/HupN/NixA family nickel/cobalt transporter [Ligilactobacillus ubinensis]MCP0885810.1 HoxN/HupN/NixA family nickel/cobalt transporter [Ligilactobacillus ubinensis]